MKKFAKSKYKKDSLLLKLILLTDNILEDEEKAPTRVEFVEKRQIDRSTFYSFDGPFQLIHADVGNSEFLVTNATIPRHVLLVVDLYSSICLSHEFKETDPTEDEINLWWSKK